MVYVDVVQMKEKMYQVLKNSVSTVRKSQARS
jgi:hypothetical protein